MNPFDNISICITSYKRTWHLKRSIRSARAAGFKRCVVASSEPTKEVLDVIESEREGWDSYRVATTKFEVGCNSLWMLAAYHSDRDRLLLLHDDDVVNPAFGPTYEKTISPLMDAGVGIASWRANHIHDDGTTHKTEWYSGPTGVRPSKDLERHVGRMGTLSLSPIVSVLDRATVIRACKEAEATLTHNDCLERPGMLLGTEILVYLRHARKFPQWLWVDDLLTMYGAHDGSGTIRHERAGNIAPLIRGYDRARVQGLMRSEPTPKPKIIFVHRYWGTPADDEERRRLANARASWDYHFGNFDMIEREIGEKEARDSAELGDDRPVPRVKDFFDVGCSVALAEDVVALSNSDIGITVDAPARLLAGVERGRGVAVCPRRVMPGPVPGRLYRTARNCKVDGGMDVVAFTPRWWESVRDGLPDFFLGREAWDLCFRTLAEEWADGPAMRSTISVQPDEWWRSRAYCDDVAWHEPHESFWKVARGTNPAGAENRRLAREFFGVRKNLLGLSCVAEPIIAQKPALTPEPPAT